VKSGVQSNVPATNVAPVGRVDELNTGVVPSGSEAVTAKFRLTFSSVFWAPIAVRTGSRFIWLTVIVTVSESAAAESSVA